jgi:hypothetical protein
VEHFKYLEMTVTNQNLIQKYIKRTLNSGNVCYHGVQNLSSSCLLPKNVKIRIYKTIVLPVVLYWCETWSLSLWHERRLRVFANRVPRIICGLKREEVTGVWRKQHNEELPNWCSLPSIIRMIKSRRIRWTGQVERMGEKRTAYRILVGKVRRKETTRKT